jgi:flagellar motor protein MotB
MDEQTSRRTINDRFRWSCGVILCVVLTGCPQNPYLAQSGTPIWQQSQQPQYAAQLTELQRRVQLLDDNNRQLHTQLAQAEQQTQQYRNEMDIVRQQLAATARDLQTARIAASETQAQLSSVQANTRPRTGASLAANTTLKRIAESANLTGIPLEYEGDVIRVRIPSDQLFQPGTAQLLPTAGGVLDPIVQAIPQAFPRQRIGIEGFTDDKPTYGGMFSSPHQLTAAQSLAVFEYLTKRGSLPSQQLFTLAQGSNYPRAANDSVASRAANRRMEIVIYPESF